MKRAMGAVCAIMIATACGTASANIFQDYEDMEEGFLGTSYYHAGVTFHTINDISGVFPDGSTFETDEPDRNGIIENATFLYNDFPDYGSPVNCMTFGSMFVPGDNLSIGALGSAWMDLDEVGDSVSFDLMYYENGPWGGIEYKLDALSGGTVVGTDSFAISDLGGRDNPAFRTMSISGVEFDQLHLYAMYGSEYSLPRGMIDDLSISIVPEPASLLLMAAGLLALRRR